VNGDTKNDVAVPEGEIGQTIMEYLDSGKSGSECFESPCPQLVC